LGWEVSSSGLHLNFAQVVSHLKAMAAKISAIDPSAPQPGISVLDVSGIESST
jgi:hypothetical protein